MVLWYAHPSATEDPSLVTTPQRSFLRRSEQGWAMVDITMKSQGEIEAAICEGVSRFEQEYMGRGPQDIHAYLLGDLLVVRLQGVLTAAEKQLVKTLPPEKRRDLLKQVRTQLLEAARPVTEAIVL